MEFHISQDIREKLGLNDLLFSFTGNVIFANVAASRKLAQRLNHYLDAENDPQKNINAGALFAMGLIDELSHALIARYRQDTDPAVLAEAMRWFAQQISPADLDRLLLTFTREFPSVAVFNQELTAEEWLRGTTEGMPHREAAFEELLLLWLANSNPAFAPFRVLFGDDGLKERTAYQGVTAALPDYFVTRPHVASGLGTLLDALLAPMLASPDSLTGQLDFIREYWAPVLGDDLTRVLLAIDVLREEEVAVWMRFHPPAPDWHRHGEPGRGGEGFVGDEYIGFESEFETGSDGVRRRRVQYAAGYQAPLNEYEAFSADQAWMPNVVLIAKSTYVWLEQLSKKYQRHIHRLDQIPDEELRLLATRGITGLWLIGLWERSRASRTIKRLRGNPDAVASAYSLKDYSIAEDLGGEAAYIDLRDRAARAGLRLASDMVPNHMGIDSTWVIEHPEWFIARPESPFPVYSFEGPDLSTDSRVEIKIEDHYYDQSDAAVVFRLRHLRDNSTRFMYHGNDGTTFAWNDTAQLDYSKADVREHVIQVILNVARRFPIIRFDAAMVLAKRHVQRLWFPLPGAGGSIPSRAEDAMSQEAFDALMPHEFWREVVDRVAVEVPGTLLLAEAFWLLEGYFVRTLGMHRVYNSAFMNMLRDEENAKYRSYLKKTVEFDPDILKRYVNFMSNPDERTAIDQFGSGDKYFGVSVLLATLPGLPMFGHGQVEGFTERYGMDFKQARLDETPNQDLIARHQQLIAPLLKNRQLFAESTYFVMYDFWNGHGAVDENVFAFSNRHHGERGVILYNNSYQSTYGTISSSVGFLDKGSGSLQQRSLADGLALPGDDSTIIAYRDHVSGLEYLRRARDFRDQGLTIGLRGYQHVALLHWRELQPTFTHPWDRLCDALNGSGVYSVDEALTQLRLRPLLDTLRQEVNSESITAFAELARKTPPPAAAAKPLPEKPAKSEHPVPLIVAAMIPETVEEPEQPAATHPPQIVRFAEKAHAFAGQIAELWNGHHNHTEPAEAPQERCVRLAAASLHLPNRVREFPAALRPAAIQALPSSDVKVPPSQVWAPVLGWLALQSLPEPAQAFSVYDGLNLRPAMAETFSSVGLEGESAWKAAAQVRVLLKREQTSTSTEEFWKDPDVRWLAGINQHKGVEYLHKEKFEELLCWLELPELLADTAETPAKVATRLARLAANSGYEFTRFLKQLTNETQAIEASVEPTRDVQVEIAVEEEIPARLAESLELKNS
jgi:glycosidase